MNTFEQLKQILMETRQIPANKIVESATFESLGLDSLDSVDILMTVEERLGIKVNLDDGMKTLADAVKVIKKSKK